MITTRFNLAVPEPDPEPEVKPIPKQKQPRRKKTPEEMKQYYRDYYLAHREHMRKTHHEWYLRQNGE